MYEWTLRRDFEIFQPTVTIYFFKKGKTDRPVFKKHFRGVNPRRDAYAWYKNNYKKLYDQNINYARFFQSGKRYHSAS